MRATPLASDAARARDDAYFGSCGHLFAHAHIVDCCGRASAAPPLLECAACEHAIFYFAPRDVVLGLARGSTCCGEVSLVTQTTPSEFVLAYAEAHSALSRPWRARISEMMFWLSMTPLRMRLAFLLIVALVGVYAVVDADLIADHSPFGWIDDAGVVVAGLVLVVYLLTRLRAAALGATRDGGAHARLAAV